MKSMIAGQSLGDTLSTTDLLDHDRHDGRFDQTHRYPMVQRRALRGCHALGLALPERAVMARLEYTAVQRSAACLQQIDQAGGTAAWFKYSVSGIDLGLCEGVILGQSDRNPTAWARDIANASGGDMFKFTALGPDSLNEDDPVSVERRQGWVIVRRPKKMREILPLEMSYETTLANLGRHTRRNIRRSRRLSDEAGLRFRAELGGNPLVTLQVLRELARRTEPAGVSRHLTHRLEHYADQTGRPFRTVVRARDGQVVSYCCGFFDDSGRNAYLLYQLNDPGWGEMGPSLLHRALLIEWLVAQGLGSLIFIHGCSGVLRHSCSLTMLHEFWVVRRSIFGYARTGAIAAIWPKSSLGRLARIGLASELRFW